jgi:2-C-methyl-D-erythritol 4-phosphate cytidylyltransferase
VKFCAIVVAAGRGVRFGRSKQLIDVAGRPLVAWCIATFGELAELDQMVIATEPDQIEELAALAARFAPRLQSQVVAGGATRQASTRNALAAVPAACDGVFVHDGARPLVTVADVRAGMAAVALGTGAVLAAPVVDTIKVVPKGSRTVARTLEREELWAAQTPQFATTVDLRTAHAAAERDGFAATDDVALLERCGMTVVVIPSSGDNFKVTQPGDRDRAEAILRSR